MRSRPARSVTAPTSLIATSMLNWPRLSLVAVLGIVAAAGSADAQTIIARKGPAGGTVEVQINDKVVATETANADGEATLIVPGPASRPDIDATVYVDSCGTRRRILFVQPGIGTPPPDTACIRRDIPGLFLVKAISTIVVSVEGPSPRLLLRQGPFDPNAPPKTWTVVPSGLMVSGGGGLGTFSNVNTNVCGNVASCEGDDTGWAYTVGAEYWFSQYLALDVSFLKPPTTSATASETVYNFTDTLDVAIVTIGGKVGVPVGPVRVYGRVGVTYERSLSSMSQNVLERTSTVDDVTTTVPGGSVTLEYETSGLGWFAGGGLELWLTRHVAFYAEGNFMMLKGSESGAGQGVLDDKHMSVLGGIRLRVGK